MAKIRIPNFAGKKVTVMGLGLFGGGVGVTRYLVKKGAKVTVTDLRGEEELRPSLKKLKGLEVAYHLGRHRDDDFSRADYVFVNPAVKPDSPYLKLARSHRVRIRTEMSLFFRLCPSPVIGVTGTLGKSTTVAMLNEMFRNSNHPYFLGGNIGISLLDRLEQMDTTTHVILELSSFQLGYFRTLKKSPHIAVITSLLPNHLEYHKTMSAYIRSKSAILRYQTKEDSAILGDGYALRYHYCESGEGRKFYLRMRELFPDRDGVYQVGESLFLRIGGKVRLQFPLSDIRVPGVHNVLNAMAAVAAAYLAGLDVRPIQCGLRDFKGIPHRFEMFLSHNNVTYVNDSKSTSPHSTLAAVNSTSRPYVLILGGHDKGLSFEELFAGLDERARLLIIMGEAAGRIETDAESFRPYIPRKRVINLQEAVEEAVKAAQDGDMVLLSPACSSYDAFLNYEERGETFKKLVQDNVIR